MNILIVEDIKQQAVCIEQTIRIHFPGCSPFVSFGFDDAVDMIKAHPFQIFILDVDLGSGESKNGIELAKYIRSIPGYCVTPILFLTALPSEVNKAVNETHCYSYLLKPYEQEELVGALSSLLSTPLVPAKLLEIRNPNGIYSRINPADIIYAEILGHRLKIHTTYNVFETNKYTIKTFCEAAPDYLVQCHRSYAVNPEKISGKDNKHLFAVVDNNTISIPIGRGFKEDIMRRMRVYE